MWENTVEPDRPQMTVWCLYLACWITKAITQTLARAHAHTHTHTHTHTHL